MKGRLSKTPLFNLTQPNIGLSFIPSKRACQINTIFLLVPPMFLEGLYLVPARDFEGCLESLAQTVINNTRFFSDPAY
jgi:hypothetical protein